MKKVLVSIFPLISIIISIVGTFGYVLNWPITILIFCGVIVLLNSLFQVLWGEQNGFTTEITALILAVVEPNCSRSAFLIYIPCQI